MTRVAIYARYSSDRQSEASAEDQARLCRERAEREGWAVTAEFLDLAVSGATRARPQLMAMMARAAEFDVVLAESIDRLSRDQEDIAAIHKRLRFAGVEIVTLADGAIGGLLLGVKGAMAAEYLTDLGDKTRRGQVGRVHAGRIPGGLSYGYRKVHRLDAKGEPERGLREVEESEAAVVRRIFRQYLLGLSPRVIAGQLNAERLPSPSGGLWRASTITGHRARRNGILYNALYAGKIVYNRQRFIRDPDTRRRVARTNPPDQWKEQDVPELRIIDEGTWSAAQARLAHGWNQPAHKKRRPRRLFSGMLRCVECEGPVTIVQAERWGCARHRETGTCGNNRLTLNSEVERRLLGALTGQLLDPQLVSEYAAAYHAATKDALARQGAAAGELKRRAKDADGAVKRLVAAIASGADLADVREALLQRSAERDQANAELAEIEAAHVVTMHPRLADLYRQRIAELGKALEGQDDRHAEARAILRGLVDCVIVHPRTEGRGVELELHGRLAEIIAFASNKKKAPAEAGAECTLKVVAGARSRLCSPLSIVRV